MAVSVAENFNSKKVVGGSAPGSNSNVQGGGESNDPRLFHWSMMAVSFGALMTVMEAYTHMRHDQMKIGNDVSLEIGNAMQAEGKAQLQQYQAQAQATLYQADQAYGQAAGSFTGIAGGVAAFGISRSAASMVEPMTSLVEQVSTIPQSSIVAGDTVLTDAQQNSSYAAKTVQQEILNGTFKYDDSTNINLKDGINATLTRTNPATGEVSTCTLQQAFQLVSGDGDDVPEAQRQTAQQKFNAMIQKVTGASTQFQTAYQSRQNYASTIAQSLNSVGTMSANFTQAAMSQNIANEQTQQGLAQQATTYAQAVAQFANTTYGNIQNAVQTAAQGVQGIFSFINQSIQAMRG